MKFAKLFLILLGLLLITETLNSNCLAENSDSLEIHEWGTVTTMSGF